MLGIFQQMFLTSDRVFPLSAVRRRIAFVCFACMFYGEVEALQGLLVVNNSQHSLSLPTRNFRLESSAYFLKILYASHD